MNTTRIEPLESRIAPAIFLAGPTNVTIRDAATGLDAMDTAAEQTAAGNVGVDAAVLLVTGDKLLFDRNGNGVADGGDTLLVQITGGNALIFMEDLDGDQVFDPGEIAGLAVSDGFAATIKTDVAGSILTALKADNTLGFTGGKFDIQNSSIAGLTITGGVLGSIAAGGSKPSDIVFDERVENNTEDGTQAPPSFFKSSPSF